MLNWKLNLAEECLIFFRPYNCLENQNKFCSEKNYLQTIEWNNNLISRMKDFFISDLEEIVASNLGIHSGKRSPGK